MRARVAFVVMLVFASIGPCVCAEEILYCSMDSKEAINAVGGRLWGGDFVDAKSGKGILTSGVKQAVEFPTGKGKFLSHKKGTIMMWVKVGKAIQNVKTESILWTAIAGGEQYLLVHSSPSFGRNSVTFAMLRLGAWARVSAGELFWEKGEIHHIAAVYGAGGMKLWVDFELVGECPACTPVPAQLPSSQWVGGNDLKTNPQSNNPTFWVQDEFRVFNTELTGAEIQKSSLLAVEPTGKLTTTWGRVKSTGVRRSPAF